LLLHSTSGQVIAPNILPAGHLTLSGYGLGVYDSCWDTDHGTKPGEPGAAVTVITGAPLPSGDARPVMNALRSATIDYSLSHNGGTTYDITYMDNGVVQNGYLTIYPDRAQQSQPFVPDTPSVPSEPGGTSPDTTPTTPSATLTEYYCACSTSTTNPSFMNCNALPKLFNGHTYQSDFIEYPKLFEQFMQNLYNNSAQYYPINADYLTS
jgi:hypothetical protein